MPAQPLMSWLAPALAFLTIGLVGMAKSKASSLPTARRMQFYGGAVALVCGIAIAIYAITSQV